MLACSWIEFPDGMFQWWSAMGVCFCEISSTTLFASVGANQESLETLYEAVFSRNTAQLGFSELPTKTETFYCLSELSWDFVLWGLPIRMTCAQGQYWFSKICGNVYWLLQCKDELFKLWDLSDDYHYSADSLPDCLLTLLDKCPWETCRLMKASASNLK